MKIIMPDHALWLCEFRHLVGRSLFSQMWPLWGWTLKSLRPKVYTFAHLVLYTYVDGVKRFVSHSFHQACGRLRNVVFLLVRQTK